MYISTFYLETYFVLASRNKTILCREFTSILLAVHEVYCKRGDARAMKNGQYCVSTITITYHLQQSVAFHSDSIHNVRKYKVITDRY